MVSFSQLKCVYLNTFYRVWFSWQCGIRYLNQPSALPTCECARSDQKKHSLVVPLYANRSAWHILENTQKCISRTKFLIYVSNRKYSSVTSSILLTCHDHVCWSSSELVTIHAFHSLIINVIRPLVVVKIHQMNTYSNDLSPSALK